MRRIPPDVDFESSWSATKSESWNNPNLHYCAAFPTWPNCTVFYDEEVSEVKEDELEELVDRPGDIEGYVIRCVTIDLLAFFDEM